MLLHLAFLNFLFTLKAICSSMFKIFKVKLTEAQFYFGKELPNALFPFVLKRDLLPRVLFPVHQPVVDASQKFL